MTTLALPVPKLVKGRFVSVEAYTDEELFERTGVRVAFTCRTGGVSKAAYDSLNLGSHVQDRPEAVEENRYRVLEAFETRRTPLVVPNQVHGDTVLTLNSSDDLPEFLCDCAKGADGLIINTAGVAALLCFADCVPLIIVSPTGRFAVVHAGWRGVMNEIACKTARLMAQQDREELLSDGLKTRSALDARTDANTLAELLNTYNVYLGPHIHGECFETSEELQERFIERFGNSCDAGYRHIHLAEALRTQLGRIGIDPRRVDDLGLCTVCHNDEFFSYRAQSGVAGRHGAFACRR